MSDSFDRTGVLEVPSEWDVEATTGSRPRSGYLVCLSGARRGRTWMVEESLRIGRGSACDVVLDASAVSREHARVQRDGDAYFVEDLGSRNGTFVNGQRVSRHELGFGDRLLIGGEVTLLFVLHNRIQEELAAAQRMEVLGRLLGGFARDFENVLSCIVSNTEVLAESLDDGELARDCVRDTQLAAQRGAELAQQLLAFSRQSGGLEPVELSAVVNDAVTLLRGRVPDSIEIEVVTEPGLVLGNRAQLSQLLLNLGVNAREAIAARGRIRIATYSDAEGRVAIQVSDNGAGMRPEERDQAFEPFFTTKRSGEGRGMGLAIVSGIVAGHGGEIQVESRPGEGSTFRVWLPAEGREGARVRTEEATRPATTSPRAGEVVLLVDDDELVLRGTRRVIERMGHEVVCALNGDEALAVVRETPGGVAVAVVDYIMTGMGGDTLVAELRRAHPGMKLVMMTGTVDRQAIGRLQPLVDAFLSKPCEPSRLREVITTLLEQTST